MTPRTITPLVLTLFAACTRAPQAPASPPMAPATDAAAVVVDDPGATGLVTVAAGTFEPLFGGRDGEKVEPVAAFALERHAVTNAQFAAFVADQPRWRRSRVSPLFADAGYLQHWRTDLDPGTSAERPVTNVSWFAARAYARWRGRRLPTLAEWELAAGLPLQGGADATSAVLRWYGQPMPAQAPAIGSGTQSESGLLDLHGVIWEWVDDFANAMGSGDARSATDLQRSLFCGAGAVGSARPDDYAAFMRYAMRSSLTGARTTRSLGFRCADDAHDEE